MALPTRPQFWASPGWWMWFGAKLRISQPAISCTDLSSPASFQVRLHGQRGHRGQAIRRSGFTKRLLTPASSWCPGRMQTTNASLAEKCGTRGYRPWNLRWFSSRVRGGRKLGGASGHCHQRGPRCVTGTGREAVSARSADLCMGTAELIWASLRDRGRCEPGRPRGPVTAPRSARRLIIPFCRLDPGGQNRVGFAFFQSIDVMFGTIRRHQTWLWAVIITITIISFVIFFGPQSRFNSSGRETSVYYGSINGQPVDK